MLDLISVLAPPLAKLLLKSWLGDTAAAVGGAGLGFALGRLKDRAKAIQAQQKANAIARALAEDLQAFYKQERVDADDLTAAACELGETVENHVGAGFLVHRQLNAEEIERGLLQARPLDSIYKPGDTSRALYLQLVQEVAPRLRAVAPELPGYRLEHDAIVLEGLARAAAEATTILSEVRAAREEARRAAEGVDRLIGEGRRRRSEFEERYRKAVLERLDYVEILGLDLERRRREVPLSVAYLSLTTTTAHSRQIDYENLLDRIWVQGARLLIEGAAGGGKSTLLRWTAVETCNQREASYLGQLRTQALITIYLLDSGELEEDQISSKETIARILNKNVSKSLKELKLLSVRVSSRKYWRECVPFLIRLRDLKDGLPHPDDLANHLSRALGRPPENWVAELLRQGSALLLIDGVDEVPEGRQREAALKSIEDYAREYERCLMIVASRPRAIEDGRLDEIGFVKAEVNDLSADQRARFIDSWHRALSSRLYDRQDEPEIIAYGEKLKAALVRLPHVARLATSPLLCAGICALHERSPEALPENEWDLCAKLTEMLVELRDRTRGRQEPVRLVEFGAAYQRKYIEKRNLLARIAEAMVCQQLSALPRPEALHQIELGLAELSDTNGITPEEMLRALEARSGVLRSASAGRTDETVEEEGGAPSDAVEFVHNTLILLRQVRVG